MITTLYILKQNQYPLNAVGNQAATKVFMTPEAILTGLNNMLQKGGGSKAFKAYFLPPAKSVFTRFKSTPNKKDVLTKALNKVRNNVAAYHEVLDDLPEEYKQKLQTQQIGLSNHLQINKVKKPSQFKEGVLSELHRLFIGGTPSNDIKAEINEFFTDAGTLNEKLVNQMMETIKLNNQESSTLPLDDLNFLLNLNQGLRLTDAQINDMILLNRPEEKQSLEGFCRRHNEAMEVLVKNFEHWPEELSDSTKEILIKLASLEIKSNMSVQEKIQITKRKEIVMDLLEKYEKNSGVKVNETYKTLPPFLKNY